MANVEPIFESVPSNFTPVQFTSADTTTKKTCVTSATTVGCRVDSIMVSTDDTTAVNLQFWINDGSTDHYIGNVNIPIGSGFTTVVRVDAITTLAPITGYLALSPTYLLKVNCLATMTAAKTLYVVPMGGPF